MKLKILVLPLLLSIISCIEVRDPDQNKKLEVVETRVFAEVRPLAQPQKYAVLIKGLSGLSQVTRKSLSSAKIGKLEQVVVSNLEAEDIVEAAGVYEYSILQNGQNIQLQVEIPHDYIIEDEMNISQLVDLKQKNDQDHFHVLETNGRVYFKARSSLLTNGENILIKAQMIESEGAIIQTFLPLQKAKNLVHGRHGGHIKLESKSIRGTLEVFMRGESGGDMLVSPTAAQMRIEDMQNDGRKGGNSGFLELQIDDQSKGRVTYALEPGQGSLGVEIRYNQKRTYKPRGVDGIAGVSQMPIGFK